MRWLAVRLGQALLTMLVALVALFILARLVPGDPLPSTDDDRPITPGQVARLRELYGLDQPLRRRICTGWKRCGCSMPWPSRLASRPL